MEKKWVFALYFKDDEVLEVHVVKASTLSEAYLEILKTEIKEFMQEEVGFTVFSTRRDYSFKKEYEELRSKAKNSKFDQFKKILDSWNVIVSDPKVM